MPPLKVALAGAGPHGMACDARHLLPKLSRAGQAQATAVIEPDPTRRKDAAEALGLAPEQCFPTPGDAWNRLDADALVIASPVAAHYETALEASAAGLHLFIEKPVSDSMARCRGVLEAVRAADVKAAVNMSACHDPEKRAFASALASRRLGTLEYIFARLARDHAAAAKHRATASHPYLMEGGVHVLGDAPHLVRRTSVPRLQPGLEIRPQPLHRQRQQPGLHRDGQWRPLRP